MLLLLLSALEPPATCPRHSRDQLEVSGRRKGHFCHQTDICPKQDGVRDRPGEINPEKGMEKQP